MVAAALYKNSALDVIYYLFHQNLSFLNHAFNRNVDSDVHTSDADAPDEIKATADFINGGIHNKNVALIKEMT